MTELKRIFPSSEIIRKYDLKLRDIKVFRSKNVALVTIEVDEGEYSESDIADEIRILIQDKLSNLKIEIELIENKKVDIPFLISDYLKKNLNLNEHDYRINIVEQNIELSFLSNPKDSFNLLPLKQILNEYEFELNEIYIDKSEFINDFIDKIAEEEVSLCEISLVSNDESLPTESKKSNPDKEDKFIVHGKIPKKDFVSLDLDSLNLESGLFENRSIILKVDFKEPLKRDFEICTISITDYKNSNNVRLFIDKGKVQAYKEKLKPGVGIHVIGELQFDNFTSSNYIKPRYFKTFEKIERPDRAERKRVELHLHTKMSTLDGLTHIDDYVKRAKYWGHEAIAITDHAGIQGFPEAYNISKSTGIKMIYGVEAYLVDDLSYIIKNRGHLEGRDTFVVFDVETTGFSNLNDRIIEIGAIKIKNGEIIDSFGTLVNPQMNIPERVVELTNITNNMVTESPTIDKVFPDFHDFIKDSILVAHNASFDIGFLRRVYKLMDYDFEYPYLDTLEISRLKNPAAKNHRLKDIAKRYNVSLVNAHRAVDDARATAEIFLLLLEDEFGLPNLSATLSAIEDLREGTDKKIGNTYHALILVRNQVGLKNLYKLISKSNLDYFYITPRIPKSELIKHREGLLIGSACSEGELVQAIILNESDERLDKLTSFYDFIEVQPIENNIGLIDEGYFNSISQLKQLNLDILKIGDRNNKLVVATGDVHYIDEHLNESRKILKYSIRKPSRDEYNVNNHFRTTEEMLTEFNYFGTRAEEVVIDNSQKVAAMVDVVQPIPNGTFPPEIEGSNEELMEFTYRRAHELYGETIPDLIKDRIDVELNSIIKNGYSVLYIIAQKLVKKSNEDGYQVGSRGSVGSSLVATLCGITEVNPLPPHYNCPSCHYTEFADIKVSQIFSGTDLPDKQCPVCGSELKRYGDDIPFEVFLGFDGDKEPDIDLNFAGEYQSSAHKYTEELFGEGYVYRAGTIGTVAEKTAYGYVKNYLEKNNFIRSNAEIERLAGTLIGVKRTTGQHAGGVMIVPKNKEIFDFTPIQYPADENKNGVITTHYDYNSISGKILKLDILGHDVPTIIKMIEGMTNTNFLEVPLNDEKVLSIFSSSEALNLNKEIFDIEVGTLGIPEFGTKFVRKMLKSTKPTTFAELVRISGLSHGTNVWTGNAEDLVNNGDAKLTEVISTREDIMSNLIHAGADKKIAFNIMERVRKDQGLSEEEEKYIKEFKLPKWYVDSCKKISYMFPKAHAVAYVTMSVRLAYYKVYYPTAFYATYLSTKLTNFNYDVIGKGVEAILNKLKECNENMDSLSEKEKNDMNIYEIALEMYARGMKFSDLDLYFSYAKNFRIIEDKIVPPLQCVANLGENVANAIVFEREIEPFISIEDLVVRTKITKGSIEHLKNIGLLKGLSETNQLSFI